MEQLFLFPFHLFTLLFCVSCLDKRKIWKSPSRQRRYYTSSTKFKKKANCSFFKFIKIKRKQNKTLFPWVLYWWHLKRTGWRINPKQRKGFSKKGSHQLCYLFSEEKKNHRWNFNLSFIKWSLYFLLDWQTIWRQRTHQCCFW